MNLPVKSARAVSGPSASRLARWVGTWRQQRDDRLLRLALTSAGDPGLVLEVPCNAARYWPVLTEKSNRIVISGDPSAALLEGLCAHQPAALADRLRPLLTTPTAIALPANAVDSVVCLRLLHQLEGPAQRLEVLREFRRVARETAIVSLRVDATVGTWQAPARAGPASWMVPRAVVEDEFVQAGFVIEQHFDAVPWCGRWRVYVLRKR